MPYEIVSDDVFVNYTFHNILQKRPKKHFHQGKQTVRATELHRKNSCRGQN